MLVYTCLSLALLGCALPLASSVSMTASPPTVEPGVTPTLTLTCNVTSTPGKFLTNLIMSVSSGAQASATAAPTMPTLPTQTTKYPTASLPSLNVATFGFPSFTTQAPTSAPAAASAAAAAPIVIAMATGGQVLKPLPGFKGTATGQISGAGDSYLRVVIPQPDDKAVAEYTCKANSMDMTGASSSLTNSVQVGKHSASPADLTKEIKIIKDDHDKLLAVVNKQNSRWEQVDHTSVFIKSPELNGRKYLLSRRAVDQIDLCQFMCIIQGGYLAEINDEAEFKFVQNFASAHLKGIPDYPDVFIGATDGGHKGKWFPMHNSKSKIYTNWGAAPASGYDCMVLSERYGFFMNDDECEGHNRFMCEVPV